VIRFIFPSLALLGLLTCGFFRLIAAPHFPLIPMLAISIAFGLVVPAYAALCALLMHPSHPG